MCNILLFLWVSVLPQNIPLRSWWTHLISIWAQNVHKICILLLFTTFFHHFFWNFALFFSFCCDNLSLFSSRKFAILRKTDWGQILKKKIRKLRSLIDVQPKIIRYEQNWRHAPPPYFKHKISTFIFMFLGQRVAYKLLYDEDIILNSLIDRIKHFEVKFIIVMYLTKTIVFLVFIL